jgi:hypothetical protein
MRRLQAPLVALTAVLVLGAASAGGAGAGTGVKPVVKNVNGWITALAFDGSRVAYATQAFAPTNCSKLFTWNPLTKAGALVSGPKSGSCGSDTPTGKRIVAVALAGPRVAWIRNITGNTEADDFLYTRVLSTQKQLLAATRTGDTSGILKGKWLGGLVGSGSVLAVNTWTTSSTGAVTSASLGSVGLVKVTPVAKGAGTLTAESADTGRVAVLRSNASVAIYSAGGTLQRTITPPTVKAIALRKAYLVVLSKTRTLQVYNSHTGSFIRSWPVPAGATNLDVNQNIAVFSVWRKVYALQLTTGKLSLLATEKRAIVAAQIEAPGVLFAYNTLRGLREIGNLAFVPLSAVKAAVS